MFNVLKSQQFEKLLEKATSNLLEPDWGTNVALCDMIRQEDVTAKAAINMLMKRLSSDNQNTLFLSLQILETWSKNCGRPMMEAIGSDEMMKVLSDIVNNSDNSSTIVNKSLELIQTWAKTFGRANKPISDVYKRLLKSDVIFPEYIDNPTLFQTNSAPEWKEGDTCHRCKSQFSTFKRRHHCRNCGNIVCDECSNKRSAIPKFGIEREVRVCSVCYNQINNGIIEPAVAKEKVNVREKVAGGKPVNSEIEAETQRLKELELQEKEELELALALSASEAETSTKKETKYSAPKNMNQEQQSKPEFTLPDIAEMEPELTRYLNRTYWENKSDSVSQHSTTYAVTPDAPMMSSSSTSSVINAAPLLILPDSSQQNQISVPNFKTSMDGQKEHEDFFRALKASLETFINRLKSNQQRNRSISDDTTVQSLFLQLTTVYHPKLFQELAQLESQRQNMERIQDKISRQREAREALNALRADHQLKLKQIETENQRIRQMAMQSKLNELRIQKQHHLQMQREAALNQMRFQHDIYGGIQSNQAFANFPANQTSQMMAWMQNSQTNPVLAQQSTNSVLPPGGYYLPIQTDSSSDLTQNSLPPDSQPRGYFVSDLNTQHMLTNQYGVHPQVLYPASTLPSVNPYYETQVDAASLQNVSTVLTKPQSNEPQLISFD